MIFRVKKEKSEESTQKYRLVIISAEDKKETEMMVFNVANRSKYSEIQSDYETQIFIAASEMAKYMTRHMERFGFVLTDWFDSNNPSLYKALSNENSVIEFKRSGEESIVEAYRRKGKDEKNSILPPFSPFDTVATYTFLKR